MKMNTFRLFSALHRFEEIEKMLNRVEHSKLSIEEKRKVLGAYHNVKKFAWIYGSFMVISLVLFATLLGLFFPEDDPQMMLIVFVVLVPSVVVVETAILVIVPLVLLRGTKEIIRKVDLGLDGKSEEELARFALSKKEKKSVSRYKAADVFWSVATLVAASVTVYLFRALDGNIFVAILGGIVSLFCYGMEDSCRVERHRIETGYYKKEYGFYCGNCKNEVTIPFENLEEYTNLKRNEAGIRILFCFKCGTAVPLFNFDQALKDYKKYKKNS